MNGAATDAEETRERRKDFTGRAGLGERLLDLEKAALHNLVDERPNAVLLGGGASENLLKLGAIGEINRRASRECHQLFGNVPRERQFVFDDESFEFLHVAVGATVG